jgi:hypothetical protein
MVAEELCLTLGMYALERRKLQCSRLCGQSGKISIHNRDGGDIEFWCWWGQESAPQIVYAGGGDDGELSGAPSHTQAHITYSVFDWTKSDFTCHGLIDNGDRWSADAHRNTPCNTYL